MQRVAERRPRVKKKARVTAAAEHELQDLLGGHECPAGLLSAMLDLWDGNPVPALHNSSGWPRGWHPSPGCSFRTAMRAHLCGAAWAGVYGFRGVVRGCKCEPFRHTCDGRGTTFLVWDLDAHRGERDIPDLAAKILIQCERFGFRPVMFTSRSGTGMHLVVFLDEAVTTDEAHEAAEVIRKAAGISHDRCQSFPSAGHESGYGTFTALPLNPMSSGRGGGLLLGDGLRPIEDLAEILTELRKAHVLRNSAATVRALANAPAKPLEAPAATPLPQAREHAGDLLLDAPRRGPPRRVHGRASDTEIIEAMKIEHPQFKRALDVAGPWKGGTSNRDAYLASMMARQGVSQQGIVDALAGLAGTKTGKRGEAYAERLLRYRDRTAIDGQPDIPLAGTPCAPRHGQASMYLEDMEINTEVAHGDRE